MRHLYANSTLNLAAVDAPAGDTGCFFQRDHRRVNGWKVEARCNIEDSFLGLWGCSCEHSNRKTWDEYILSTRAWVFQESCLAPRTLNLGIDQIAWTCRRTKACETFPGAFQNYSVTNLMVVSKERQSYRSLDVAWFEIVFSYSEGKLTFGRDKLAALSGIARLFARNFGATYLARLWKEDLYKQFVWEVIANPAPKILSTYRAPSWSWASINSSIGWNGVVEHEHLFPLVEIEEVSVSSPGDLFDEVDGGELWVRYFNLYQGSIGTFWSFRGREEYRVRYSDHDLILGDVFPDHKPHELSWTIYYLPILVARQKGRDVELSGVVLKAQSNRYVRVGSFFYPGCRGDRGFPFRYKRKPVDLETLERDLVIKGPVIKIV